MNRLVRVITGGRIRSLRLSWTAALAMVVLAMITTAPSATAASSTGSKAPAVVAAPNSSGINFYAGYLAAGSSGRYCFQFDGYQNTGPVLVSATAREYNVIVTTVSTDLTLSGSATWVYCTTLQNVSSVGSGVDVAARASLSGTPVNLGEGSLAAGATGRYCFNFNSHTMTGPLAVSAAATTNATLTTVSTDLENRQNYGWVYCATIRNSSSTATPFTLMTMSSLSPTNKFNYYAGYLAAGATGRYCFNYPPAAVPVAVTAAATEYNAVLTTVSTDRENRLNYGLVYCATIRNSAAIGTGVNLQTSAGF